MGKVSVNRRKFLIQKRQKRRAKIKKLEEQIKNSKNETEKKKMTEKIERVKARFSAKQKTTP